MSCPKCRGMLYSHAGKKTGNPSALALDFWHHSKLTDLQQAVDTECHFCDVVWEKINSLGLNEPSERKWTAARKFLSARLWVPSGLLVGRPQLYRLDFRVEGVRGPVASFILEKAEKTGVHHHEEAYHAGTQSTSADEVFDLAKSWIRECYEEHEECRRPTEKRLRRLRSARSLTGAGSVNDLRRTRSTHDLGRPRKGEAEEKTWYPTRLLDLQDVLDYKKAQQALLKSTMTLNRIQRSNTSEQIESNNEQLKLIEAERSNRVVRLVSQKENEWRLGPPTFTGKYVTLSHCWGKAQFQKLTRKTLNSFLDGIPFKDLPKTFQDAIDFACTLVDSGVRWLWIDALCIIQKDSADWLAQSKQMHEIYTNSFCNISATAASDNSKGLFYRRQTKIPWVETVTLNTKGLTANVNERVMCTTHDLSFWRDTVENAPVNRRSWVFQERLLTPRVVHWCKNQIAFECRRSDRAESRPGGLRHYQVQGKHVIEDTRLKSIDLETGKRLRDLRLKAEQASFSPNRRNPFIPPIYLYEIWRRHVELYSRMELTVKGDRLIALSGIARRMEMVLRANGFGKEEYVAGMWAQHMASQLLWYVNDAEGDVKQPYENTRPAEYRAPTFSWASVETGRGITFPETTENKGLLMTVEAIRLLYRKEEEIHDVYGLLTDGYLVLRGVLRKVEVIDMTSSWKIFVRNLNWLQVFIVAGVSVTGPIILGMSLCRVYDLQQPWMGFMSWTVFCVVLTLALLTMQALLSQMTHVQAKSRGSREWTGENRYRWRLIKGGQRGPFEYEVMWLDSPATAPSIFGRDGNVFCLPVAKDHADLTSLLLQAVVDGEYGVRYRRIGLTKIPLDKTEDILTTPGRNKVVEGKYYYRAGVKTTGDSTICII